MERSMAGTQVLYEEDIIDIIKQHFYRYGQGFKQVRLTVDLVERSRPKIGMEIALTPLNTVLPDDKIDKIYYSLLDSCKDATKVEDTMMNKLYSMVSEKKITKKDFFILIKRLNF
jgi:hypothetical protein